MTDQSKLANETVNILLDTAARHYSILAPKLNARTDALKTVISISSGSVVLLVTFSSAFKSIAVGPIWRYLIVFGFGLFVVSLLSAFLSLWIGTLGHHLQSNLLDKQMALRGAVQTARSAEDFDFATRHFIEAAIRPAIERDPLANRLFVLSAVSLCLAIISLAAVGIRKMIA